MTAIAWPTVLPAPLRAQHGYTPRGNTLATNMGVVPRSREIYSDAPADLQLSFKFTADQWAYFEGWYRYVLRSGTQWFLLPSRLAGVTDEREVSFNGQPFSALLAGVQHGRLTATVITRKGTQMDADTWEVISVIGIGEYGELLAGFAKLANVDMPESIGA